MTLTRYLLLTVAMFAGTYAAVSWLTGMLTDAGVAGAISAAAVLATEGIAYCQRSRMRAGREQVWERREMEPGYLFRHLEPQLLEAIRRDDELRAVWPHEVGGFE